MGRWINTSGEKVMNLNKFDAVVFKNFTIKLGSRVNYCLLMALLNNSGRGEFTT